MKKIALFLLVLSLVQLRADNWLINGDFTDGIGHWRGNGQAPSDFAPANPFDKPDALTSKGIVIELKNLDWRKIQQDFKGKLSNGVLTVTYLVSPDCAFSEKKEDYANVPDHIGYDHWLSFDLNPGTWIVFLSDFGSDHGTYYPLKPKLGSTDPDTIKLPVHGLTPYSDKTICLAFPPGKGKVVILHIGIDDN